MTLQYHFHSRMHLKRPQDFEQVYANGVRAGDAHLLIFALKNGLQWSRLGLSVSKKHGGAVRRNLKRRQMKEAFRLLQHELPVGMDLILIPRQRDDSSVSDYQASLTAIVSRLVRRINRPGQVDGEGATQ